jgi:hypothetical protein
MAEPVSAGPSSSDRPLGAAYVKTVAIVQSSYIPWKGFFDLVNRADELVLLDDVQFTRRDWRNRNRIKTPQGLVWLTIPVEVKGRYHQTVRETQVAEPCWSKRHLASLRHSYARAPFFHSYELALEALYADIGAEASLSVINRTAIETICALLEIGTTISSSAEFALVDGRTERLVSICRQAEADRYLSGPTARAYLDEARFRREGIDVTYMDYDGYPEYRQLYPPFEHAVSIVDLLVHVGPDARRHMKSF